MSAVTVSLPPIPGRQMVDKSGNLTTAWQAWFYQVQGYLGKIKSGNGAPETFVKGNVGDVYLNTAGGAGTTFYVKESGAATNTGWVGK